MSVPIQTVAEVTRRARNALIQELGVVDTLRFLNQFRAGSGDYATEREQLFKGESVKSIVAGVNAQGNADAQQGKFSRV